jgi:signal transduction histidine kinase
VGLNRGQASDAEDVAVDDLVQGQITEWLPAFEAAGRRLRRQGTRGLVVSVARGAQAQALATLLENALVHGEGTTTVLTRPAGAWSVVEVSDEGAGVPEELGARVFERSVSGGSSSGLGLALARTLVAADGGRLEMVSARPAVFAMFLPAATGEDGALPVLPAAEPELEDQTVVAMTASSAASGSSGNTQRR